MNHHTWIGVMFSPREVLELTGPHKLCCDRIVPRVAKFCMVCGKETKSMLLERPEHLFQDEWGGSEILDQLPLPKWFGDVGWRYPREPVQLDQWWADVEKNHQIHITVVAQWVYTGYDNNLVIGMSLGGNRDPFGIRGREQALWSVKSKEGFEREFKEVQRWLKRHGVPKRKVGMLSWASMVMDESPHPSWERHILNRILPKLYVSDKLGEVLLDPNCNGEPITPEELEEITQLWLGQKKEKP